MALLLLLLGAMDHCVALAKSSFGMLLFEVGRFYHVLLRYRLSDIEVALPTADRASFYLEEAARVSQFFLSILFTLLSI